MADATVAAAPPPAVGTTPGAAEPAKPAATPAAAPTPAAAHDEKEKKKDSSHLAQQSLENLDTSKLHPLSPEVISRQATINIGACPLPLPLSRPCAHRGRS